MSSPGRMTRFISSVSITPKRAFNWPKQPFNPFAACVLNLERRIWLSLNHLYWAYRDYDRAKAELAIARRTLPNESRIPLLSGYIYRRQGHWEKSLEEMKKALELDPHNFSILQQISLTYQALRRYKEALSTLDSVLAIAPKDVPSRVRRAWVDRGMARRPKTSAYDN